MMTQNCIYTSNHIATIQLSYWWKGNVLASIVIAWDYRIIWCVCASSHFKQGMIGEDIHACTREVCQSEWQNSSTVLTKSVLIKMYGEPIYSKTHESHQYEEDSTFTPTGEIARRDSSWLTLGMHQKRLGSWNTGKNKYSYLFKHISKFPVKYFQKYCIR